MIFDFLNALFGPCEGDICFDHNGSRVDTGDPDFIAGHAHELYVFPQTKGGAHFVYRVVEGVVREVFEECAIRPTATLLKEARAIFCWAFPSPIAADDPDLVKLTGEWDGNNDAIPLPGVNGWEMVDCDFERTCGLADLLNMYGGEPVTDEVQTRSAVKKYGDAVVYGEYNPSNYAQLITVTIAGRSDSKNWRPQPMPLSALIDKLCKHEEDPNKDGISIVFADMVPGQRLKNSVKTIPAIGLDNDTGTPVEVIDAALQKLNCLAFRYTTHSNGKTKTEFKKDNVAKHAQGREIDTELMQEFCATVEHWDESIVRSVEYTGEDHTKKGIVVRVEHIPMPKNRAIVFLKEPYEVAKEGATQLEATKKWGKYPEALAAKLGIPFDRSCIDPSRLFFLPRHPPGAPFSISLFAGELFDRRTLVLDGDYDALVAETTKKGSKSKTPEGKALGKWSIKNSGGFQIADVIEQHAPDKIRGTASSGFTIECPFDDDHSNPGDPDDAGCYAVNAADGGNEFMIIKCQHESCRDKTFLDMLGQMLKREWFPRELIDDPEYNILLDESVTHESAGGVSSGTKAVAVPAFEAISQMIDGLCEDAGPSELEPLLKAIAAKKLLPSSESRLVQRVAEKTGLGVRALQGDIKLYRSAAPTETGSSVQASDELVRKLSKSLGRKFQFPADHFGTFFLEWVGDRPWLSKEVDADDHQSDDTTDIVKGRALCTPFVLVGATRYADRDGARALRIDLLNGENEFITVDLDAGSLAQTSGQDIFRALHSAGFCVAGNEGRDFVLNYLRASQVTGPVVYHRPGLRDDAFILPTGEVIPRNAKVELAREKRLKCVARAGSLEGWRAGAFHIFGMADAFHTHLAVLIGLSGPVGALVGMDAYTYSFDGATTAGKSYREMMVVSHWAEPKLGRGLFIAAKGTANSNESPRERASGTVLALDEVSALSPQDEYNLIFMNQGGQGKRRSDVSGNSRRTAEWEGGALVLSAETPLMQRLRMGGVAVATGLTVRAMSISFTNLLRLEGADWEAAEAIVANYGWSGPAFVQSLFDKGHFGNREALRDRFEALKDSLPLTQGSENAQRRRASNGVAVLLLTACLAADAGLLPEAFDAEGFALRLWNEVLASDLAPVHPAETAAQKLLENIVAHKGLDILKLGETGNREIMGYFGVKHPAIKGELYVIRNSALAALSGGGTDDKSLRKQLEKMEVLVRDPNKPDTRSWSGFPGITKVGQFTVLKMALIDDEGGLE